MLKNREYIYGLSIVILSIISIFFAIALLLKNFDVDLWLKLILSITFFGISISLIIFKMLKKDLITKILIIIDIILIVIGIGYFILWSNNWLVYFNSAESIKKLILSAGIWGQLVFLLIQFLQVTLLPIPSVISTLAGVAIYGPFITFIISCIGIITGSLVSFFIGRIFGRPICEWVAGKDTTNKYASLLNEKGKLLLPIMFLLPVFPDDLLCMIAGITTMKMSYFLICTLLVRPIGIITTCYVGSGEIIPFHGWGLYVWPFIIIFLIFLFWFCYKYQSKIEDFFKNNFSLKNSKIKNNESHINNDSSNKIKNDNKMQKKDKNVNNLNINQKE